jgi:hypothetical protein
MLPNGDRAILDLRKLVEYCLNPAHSRGRHKARVFRESLGIGQAEAAELRALLLSAAAHEAAIPLPGDAWGDRWQIDVAISRRRRRAVVRTIWILLSGEQIPRFVTCWVL